MEPHNGIIEIQTIENSGSHADHIGLLHVQFVHYPDCQQLQIWLPQSEYQKWDYGNYQIVNKTTQTIVEQGFAPDIITGSVKILFDTLGFPEGEFVFEIEHPTGSKHCLHFEKHREIIPGKPMLQVPPSTTDNWRETYW